MRFIFALIIYMCVVVIPINGKPTKSQGDIVDSLNIRIESLQDSLAEYKALLDSTNKKLESTRSILNHFDSPIMKKYK